MSEARHLARLTTSIFTRAMRGEQDGSFYRDVEEAIELAREVRKRDPESEAHMWEIERRLRRIKSRRSEK